jgi:hypothetical protein
MDNSQHIEQFAKREFSANLDLALERSKQWSRKKQVVSIGSKLTTPSFSKPQDIITYINSIIAAIKFNNTAIQEVPDFFKEALKAIIKAHDTSFKSAAGLFDQLNTKRKSQLDNASHLFKEVPGCEFEFIKLNYFSAATAIADNEDHWDSPAMDLIDVGGVRAIAIKEFQPQDIVFDKDSLAKVVECIRAAALIFPQLDEEIYRLYNGVDDHYSHISYFEAKPLLEKWADHKKPDQRLARDIVETFVDTPYVRDFTPIAERSNILLGYLGKAIVHAAELAERSNNWLKSKNVN